MPSLMTQPLNRQKIKFPLPPRCRLSDLLASPKDFETLSQELNRYITRLEQYRPRLRPNLPGFQLMEILYLTETIRTMSSRLAAYAQLWFAQNTKNQAARAFDATVKERLTEIVNRSLFFDLWWQKLDQANATRLLQDSGNYRYHLESLRRFKHHTLSEAEERIINLKNNTGQNALDMLYGIVTNNFSYKLKIGCLTKTLTRETLSQCFRHPSNQVRQDAYQILLRVYAEQRDVIGEMYKTFVLDWKNEGLNLRGHASPIAVRNLGNDIPDQVIHVLLKTCKKNASTFQHYFRLKAKICGIPRINRYHIYAPRTKVKTRIPYPVAVRTVLDAYRHFSPTLAEKAKLIFTQGHIDARTVPGKMAGAFCYSVLPNLTPYVFLNYTEDTRDVATLAHELGHAVHSMMAAHHAIFTFHPTLPLAETASVFGEQLLADALYKQENNGRLRQSLLMAQLDDLYATILRQAYFVIFENQAHEMIAKGATIDELGDRYLTLLREQFGKTVSIPDEFQWEWLTISHLFRAPFYCYAYSFGNLLALALYQQYREEGESFVPKYLKLWLISKVSG